LGDEVWIMLNAELEEVIGFLSDVAEWTTDRLIAVAPVLLQIVPEESHFHRWQQ